MKRRSQKDEKNLKGHLDPAAPQVESAADSGGANSVEPTAEKQVQELTADLQRLQAEFQNYKRREGEAKGEIMTLAKREIMTQLLPVLDNIDRALGHRPQELADNAWAQGVEQVAKNLQETLKKLGVEKIKSLGQSFDHNLHEAIGFEDGDGDQEVVIEELQPGYRMGEAIIRHAMVRVGKK
jgi:molecular chaperone GrpE